MHQFLFKTIDIDSNFILLSFDSVFKQGDIPILVSQKFTELGREQLQLLQSVPEMLGVDWGGCFIQGRVVVHIGLVIVIRRNISPGRHVSPLRGGIVNVRKWSIFSGISIHLVYYVCTWFLITFIKYACFKLSHHSCYHKSLTTN